MQWAFASRSSGMPLSGAAITSLSTTAASFSRLIPSLSLASIGTIARAATRIIRILTSFYRPGEPLKGLGATIFSVHESHQTWCFVEPIRQGCLAAVVWREQTVGRVTAHGQVTSH